MRELSVSLFLLFASLGQISLSYSATLTPKARFEHLTISDGLPNKTVAAIKQDHQGFIWLGTFNGLARFDGYRLKNFVHQTKIPSSLSDNHIQALEVDSKGTIWVATSQGGLNQYNADTQSFTPFRHQPNNANSLSSDNIKSILDNGNGTLYIGTSVGLDLFDITSGQITRLSQQLQQPNITIPPGPVRALYKTKTGDLWVGTESGLGVKPSDTNRFTTIALPGKDKPSLRSITEDNQGNIWIAALHGLFKFNIKTKQVETIKQGLENKRMLSVLNDSSGMIWAGSTYNGVFRISPNGQVDQFAYDKNDPTSLTDNVVMSLFEDEGGVIWTGTFSNGVSRIAPNTMAFGHYNANNIHCLVNPVIRTFLEQQKTLWLGTQDGLIAVDRINGQCKRYEHDPTNANSLSSAEVVSLFAEKQHLWIGTGKGLTKLNLQNQQFEKIVQGLPDAGVDIIFRDKNQRLIIGTPYGLYIQSADEETFIPVKTDNDAIKYYNVVSLAYDDQGVLWAATLNGLARFNSDTDRLEFTNQQQPWLIEPSYGLLNHQNYLYIATETRGLLRLNFTSMQIEQIALKDTLPANAQLYSILADKQKRLWISSSHGLLRYNPSDGSAHLFHQTDGLQSEVFLPRSAYRTADGQLMFGGNNGFNRFYPTDIRFNQQTPKLAFTQMSHFNQPVGPGHNSAFQLPKAISQTNEITLNHDDLVIGFEFSALDYADPSRNLYAYQLLGVDPHWNYTKADNRRVGYTNLDSGQYVLQVKAANKDARWNKQGIKLTLTVRPAPWETWWALTIYVLCIVTLALGYFKYRTANLERRAKQLEQSVAQRTHELAQEKQTVEQLLSQKNDEFANVSHEFRTPLTLVLGPVGRLISQETNPENQTALEVIKRNAYRLLRMVDQLLDMEKFRVQKVSNKKILALQPLMSLIAHSFKDLAEEKQLTLAVGQIDDVYLSFTPDAIEKILLNLISNAIKYTLPNGHIDVSAIAQDSSHVLIRVTDTGIGIAPELQAKVFERFHRVLDQKSEKVTGAGIGLALVKELVEAHQGSISLQSAVGEGTTIEVILKTCEKQSQQTRTANQQIIELELENLSEQQLNHNDDSATSEQDPNKTMVLVVEDNPDMRNYILSCLTDKYNCISATNGQAGFESAQQNIPDLIVSDVMMPVMDGYQLTKAIKSDEKTSHIPVVLLTARGDRESRLKGWYEKADEYLTKPFDPHELLIRINNLIEIRDLLIKRFSQTVFEHTDDDTPNKPEPTPENQKLQAQQAFLDKLNEAIAALYQRQQTKVPDIAAKMHMGEWQLLRKLKGTLNMTVAEYLRRYRLEKACELLKQGQSPNIVALEVGFASHSYFTRCFSAQFGCSPSQYKG